MPDGGVRETTTMSTEYEAACEIRDAIQDAEAAVHELRQTAPTAREFFAGLALVRLAEPLPPSGDPEKHKGIVRNRAKLAVQYADALVEALAEAK
jgi:hypothetical protein